jgi:hypothetical protein
MLQFHPEVKQGTLCPMLNLHIGYPARGISPEPLGKAVNPFRLSE